MGKAGESAVGEEVGRVAIACGLVGSAVSGGSEKEEEGERETSSRDEEDNRRPV